MKQHSKVFLFLIIQFFLFNSLFATDLYWIGGNGSWTNPSNWSISSGGSSANRIPTVNDNVIFDNKSSNSAFVVEITSIAESNHFNVLGSHQLTLQGKTNSSLSIQGNVSWNNKLLNNHKGEIELISQTGQTNSIDFSGQIIHGNLNVSGAGTIEFISDFWLKSIFNFLSGDIHINNSFIAAESFKSSLGNSKSLNLQSSVLIIDQTINNIPPSLQINSSTNSYTNLNPNLKPKISGPVLQKLIVGFTIDQNNVSCHGFNDGKAWVTSITTTGSSGPFAYQWRRFSNNAIVSTTDTAFNLSGGLYSLRITDLSDNTFSQQFVSIIEPSEIGTLIFATDETCINSCDGVINVSTTGGTPPYTFEWSDNQTTSTAFGLCDGTYTLTITDANGCTRLDTAVVGEPSLILPNVSTTNVDCFGNCNGTATANPTGGTGTYVNYEWSTSQAGPTLNSISSLCAGSYFVTVTDSDGCTNSDTFNITEPSAPLSVNVNSTNAICFGTTTGTINVTPSGGTSPYTYLWSDSPTIKDRPSVAAGNYTVTVTDDNGCTVTGSATITEPSDISISFTSVVDVDCNGDATGSATASPSGGTPPYTGFLWSNNDATPTANNLAAGFHRVTVTDNNGCTKVDSVEITEPTAVQVTVDNQTDPLCNGDANGIINTTPSGGVGPYSYAWSDGPSSAEDRTNLRAGSYSISVTDANGCLATTNVVLNNPPLLTIIIDSLENVSCNSGSDGYARALATGGTGALTYNWSNIGMGSRSNPNLSAGTYTVTVTDANNCTATAVANITQPTNALSASITKTDASCNGQNDGTATANGSGGTSPYSYDWGANGTTQTITGLSVGNYTVTITDQNGCTAQTTTTIAQPTSVNVSIVGQNLSCNGNNSGEAEAMPTGGTPPYSYQWNDANTQSTKTAINLPAGSYTVTVTDDNGCTGTANVTLTEPPVLTASISSSTPPSCNGGSNGTATASASGGTSPYTYQWSDAANQTTQTASNLTAGTYFVTITDDSLCTAIASVNITQPAPITMTFDPEDVSCFGGNDGSVTVSNVSGGQPPYTYSWSHNPVTPSVSGLTAGTYTLTVTDDNGCIEVRVANITEPSSALAVAVSGTDVLCSRDTTGTVTAVASGGTSPYSYQWSSGDTTASVTKLLAGTYTVTVTDDNGCTANGSHTVNQPSSLNINFISSTDPSCFNSLDGSISVNASGGVSPYSYQWNDPSAQTTSTATGLGDGAYDVTLTDDNGCTATASFSINEPSDLILQVDTVSHVSCTGNADGSIVVSASGGTPNYTFQPASNINNLSAGTYTITVTDANNCQTTTNVTINEPSPLSLGLDSMSNVSCNGGNDGFLAITPFGGTSPYTFLWSNNSPLEDQINITAGSYQVTVTDANGCTYDTTFFVSEPSALNLTFSSTNIPCNSGLSGSATANVTGGVSPYSYLWSNNDTTQTISNLAAGTYSVTITDNNSCIENGSVTISQSTNFTFQDTLAHNRCFGDCNGSINVFNTSGGTPPYSFNWSANATTTSSSLNNTLASNLCAGRYSLTITDALNCDTVISYIISENPALTASLSSTNSNCNTPTGTATANPSGGVAPYTYSWLGTVQTSQTATNLSAGNYQVEITDAFLCRDTFAVVVNNYPDPVVNLSTQPTSCFGANDGLAIASTPCLIGSTCTIEWFLINGTSTNVFIDTLIAGAGTYVSEVISNGCVVRDTIIIMDAPQISAFVVTNNQSCGIVCNGNAKVFTSGGTPPYSYNWGPGTISGQATDSIFNLCDGAYSLTITDANGCTINTNFIIDEDTSTLNISFTQINPACSGGSNGSVTANVSGGASPYNFNWSNSDTSATISNLASGWYHLTVTDANNCSKIDSVEIQNAPSFAFNDSIVNVFCNGKCTGLIRLLDFTSANSPYTFNWSSNVLPANEQSTSTESMVINLCAGNYSVTITDAFGCDSVANFTITEPSAISANLTSTLSHCNIDDGTATVSASGGTPPYSYLWIGTGGQSNQTATGLDAGFYQVIVTDIAFCSDTFSVVVNDDNAPSVSLSSQNASCATSTDGLAIANSICLQNNSCTIEWLNFNGSTTNVFSDTLVRGAGTYISRVTLNGCVAFDTITINAPSPITANLNLIDQSCGNICNGSAKAVPSGGIPPYTYNWSPSTVSGQGTDSIFALCRGNYSLTITDANNCDFITNFIIASSSFVVNLTKTDISCNGANDGSISTNIVGGTAPYTYNWSGSLSGANPINVSVGTYFLTVTDNLGCSAFDTIDIIEPNIISVQTSQTATTNCSPATPDGTATLTPSGGTSPYTYSWYRVDASGNITTSINQTDSIATSLQNFGGYAGIVTDANGCRDTSYFLISSPNGPQLNYTVSDESCQGSCNGAINIFGSCIDCNHALRDENLVILSIIMDTTFSFTNLCSGTYYIQTTNMTTSCVSVDTITIGSGSSFTMSAIATDVSCNGFSDGNISTTINGGTPPFTYTWSGSINGANPTNVSANTYFVTVTDDVGCTVNDTIIVGEPSPINTTLTTNNTTLCTSCDGSAIASPTGGTPPFTYEWLDDNFISIGQSTDTAINLCSAIYNVIVTDANGCMDTIVTTINSDDGPELIYTTIDESCASACDGSIDVTNPCVVCEYELADMNGVVLQTQGPATSISFTNLCSDMYVLTVSDLNTAGCSKSDTLLINSNPSLTINLTATDVSCNGLNDGSINSTITGGTAPYTYSWTGGHNVGNPTNLAAGNYDVTVTDANGCTNTASISVTEPNAISFSTSTTPASCNSNNGTATVVATGGTGTIQFTWMDNSMMPIGQSTATATGLGAGLFFVNLIDDNGCEEFLAVLINNSNGPFANIFFTNETCENSCDGTVSVDADCIDNGTCTIEWRDNNGQMIGTTDSIVGLCAGDYFVTLTDTAGCITNMQTIVSPANTITATLSSENSTCNNCDGMAIASANGGTGNFSYEWFDNLNNSIGTEDTLKNVCAGVYFVEVTDQNNCTERFNVSVIDDSGENFTLSTTDVSCGGNCDGSATVNVPCLDPVCEVRWFTSTATPIDSFITTINGLCAGDYYVEVTNGSGCKSIENFTIIESDEIEVNATIVDATCNSNANGSIALNPSGGLGIYTYNWSPAPTSGQGTNTASGLLAGTYYVTVSDNVCSVIDTFIVSEPLELNATYTTLDAICGLTNGSAYVTASGGTAPYTYQWYDAANNILAGETSDTLNNVSSGIYRLRISDNNSCEKYFTVIIDDSDGPTVTLDNTVDNICYGGNSGEIEISAIGLNGPFTYNWLPYGQGSEDIKNLTAGIYTVIVTNSLGCSTSETYTINEPTEMLANFTKVDADCGLCNGSASLVVTGGTAPYTYVWSNGSSQTNASNLCAGVYSVKVSDANGCSETFNFNINNDGGITGENINTTATCLSSCSGSATVTPIGGTPPYSYFWIHNGSTQNSLSNMCVGTYFIQITDNNNCTRISEVNITGPSANLGMVENVTPVTCDGSSCNGSIFLNVSGGLPPYTYNWTPGTFGNTNFISGLCQGLYNVTVTDANLCSISKTITVGNKGNFFDADPVATDVSCFDACDGSLSSNHDLTGQFTSQWLDANGNAIAPPNTDIPSGVCAGNYILEVTQLTFGCQTFYQVEVEEPDTMLVLPTITEKIDCFGDCDGSISVSVLGGTLPYTFAWDDPNNQNTSHATNLCSGDYTITVSDDNGCVTSLTTTLNNPTLFTVDIIDSTGVNCSSECTGTATSTISGGTPPYTFNWTGGQNVQNPIDLCYGKNILTVTDSKGCMVMDSVLISAQDTVDAIANADQIICEGEDIVLSGTILGNNITSFGWYEMPSGNFLTQKLDTSFVRSEGDYKFILVATNGICTDTAAVNIHIDPSPTIDAGGTITLYDDDVERISLFGADVSYIYVWTPREGLSDTSIAEPVVSVRETTTYHISVTNVEGCEAKDSILVIYYPELRVPTGITPNGDGVNDVWNIDFIDRFPNAEITIFNRWGEELFHSRGYNTPWDGTYKGKALPVGTYYYIVDLKDDKYETMTGPLTIMR